MQPKERQNHDRSGKCQGRSALQWEGMASTGHEEWVRYKGRNELKRIWAVVSRALAKVEADQG